jgi:hypothetical protein
MERLKALGRDQVLLYLAILGLLLLSGAYVHDRLSEQPSQIKPQQKIIVEKESKETRAPLPLEPEAPIVIPQIIPGEEPLPQFGESGPRGPSTVVSWKKDESIRLFPGQTAVLHRQNLEEGGHLVTADVQLSRSLPASPKSGEGKISAPSEGQESSVKEGENSRTAPVPVEEPSINVNCTLLFDGKKDSAKVTLGETLREYRMQLSLVAETNRGRNAVLSCESRGSATVTLKARNPQLVDLLVDRAFQLKSKTD